MPNSLRIATVLADIDPCWGGPSVSVPALARALHQLNNGAEFFFASQEVSPSWPNWFHAYPHNWPRWSRRSTTLRQALANTCFDIVHHHALWLPSLSYAHQAARRHNASLVISPRGMFSDWALRRSRWKKAIARQWIHPGAFQAASGWHATSNEEADDIRRYGLTQPIVVAPNGVDRPAWNESLDRTAWLEQAPAAAKHRVVLFYSRFHPVKGLEPLLDMWTQLGSRHPEWHLLIAGSPQAYSVSQVEQMAQQRNLQQRVSVVDARHLAKPYPLAELYVLPTQTENFGMTIAESLAAGTPVLTTTGAPWKQLEPMNAGRCVPLAEFAETLDSLLQLDSAKLRTMGHAGAEWMERDFSWHNQASQLLDFYQTLRPPRSQGAGAPAIASIN